MPEKKKPIPKYRLNYLMKRIEEEGERKIREIGTLVEEKAAKKIEALKEASGKDMTATQMIVKVHGILIGYTNVRNARRRILKRNKDNNRTRGGYGPRTGAEPSCHDMLLELSGEQKRMDKLNKNINKVQATVWPERSKRTNKVRDFVRNIKDEYYLGHDVDLVNCLESFKKKVF